MQSHGVPATGEVAGEVAPHGGQSADADLGFRTHADSWPLPLPQHTRSDHILSWRPQLSGRRLLRGDDGGRGPGTTAVRESLDDRRADRGTDGDGPAGRGGIGAGGARAHLRPVWVVPAGRRDVRAQNNRWWASTEQCITAAGSGVGFTVDTARHTNTTGPASYPSIHPRLRLRLLHGEKPVPAQGLRPREPVLELGDVAADRRRDPAVQHRLRHLVRPDRHPGGTQHRRRDDDLAQPDLVGAAHRDEALQMTLAGARWEVWYGRIDLPVISFVRKTPVTSVSNLPLTDFVREATRAGVVKSSWYLTSVQAGFEPWTGGTGLRTSSFSVTRNGA